MTIQSLNAGTTGEHEAGTRAPTLFIDATGLLLWPPGKALAGIPRIEEFLVKAALVDPDPAVEVVAFRAAECRFEPLAPFEQDYWAASGIAPFRARRRPGTIEALSQALRSVRQYPWGKRDADRHLAMTVTSGKKGPGFHAVRLLIRAYRSYRRVLGRLGWRQEVPHRPVDAERSLVLISNHILTREDRSAISGDAKGFAFICHDLIPVLRPDLVGSGLTEKAFGTYLERLVRSGATAFCTSAEASVTLTDHMRQAGIAPPVIHRFPMPSILYETASRLDMTSRFEPDKPFVLYCSTIEVRKNHIMLARIWRQALEDGVSLPRLVCVGRRGWMVEALNAYLKGHPELAGPVTFTGPISDEELIRHYRSASFGVFPSHIEGWGYGASECLDFGVPVIVSKTPSLIEATGGLMPAIESTDQAGWYAAIRRMAEDTEWRSSLTDRIARQHWPTPAAASWAAIKVGLKAGRSGPPEALG